MKIGDTGNKKENTIDFAMLFSLFVVFLPIVFTILFSVPSADDFSVAYNVGKYGNILYASLGITRDYWFNWAGDFFLVFIQCLLNPLNFTGTSSYMLGVFLAVAFCVFFGTIYAYFTVLYKYIFKLDNRKILNGIFVIFSFFFINTAIYKEIYYWYVGNAYLVGMVLHLLTQILIVLFFKKNDSIHMYVLLSVIGFLTCSGYQAAVFTGIVYIILYYYDNSNKTSKIKKIIPLLFMIIGGLLGVFAPGNFKRHGGDPISVGYLCAAVVGTVQSVTSHYLRVFCDTLFVMLLISIFLLGYISEEKIEVNSKGMVIIFLGQYISMMGVIFPVVLGSNSSRLPNRIEFITFLTLGLWLALSAFYLGIFVKNRLKKRCDNVHIIMLILVAIICLFACTILKEEIKGREGDNYPWTYTLLNMENVVFEGDFYKDMLGKLESMEEDEIVFEDERPNVTGILQDPRIGNDPNEWTNRAYAQYIHKKSVTVFLD